MKQLLPLLVINPEDHTQTINPNDRVTYDGSILSILEQKDLKSRPYIVSLSYDFGTGWLFARFNDGSEKALDGFLTTDDLIFVGKGKSGSAGRKGRRGDPGLEARDGRVGPSGCVGIRGDAGRQGATGNSGAVGESGEKGLTGPAGDDGLIGFRGFPGDSGPDGLQGVTGDTGSAGIQGDAGSAGPKGWPGRDGPQGCPGVVGERGRKGEIGGPGIKGEIGETGTTIFNGEPGPDGKDGQDSADHTLIAGSNMTITEFDNSRNGFEYYLSASCLQCPQVLPDCATTTTIAGPTIAPTQPGCKPCDQWFTHEGLGGGYCFDVGDTTGDLVIEYEVTAVDAGGKAWITVVVGENNATTDNYIDGTGTLRTKKDNPSDIVNIYIGAPTFSPAPTARVKVKLKINCLDGASTSCGQAIGDGSNDLIVPSGQDHCVFTMDLGAWNGSAKIYASNISSGDDLRVEHWSRGSKQFDKTYSQLKNGVDFLIASRPVGEFIVYKKNVDINKDMLFTLTFNLIPAVEDQPKLIGSFVVSGKRNCSDSRTVPPANAVSFNFPEDGTYDIEYIDGAVDVNSDDPSNTWRTYIVVGNVVPGVGYLEPQIMSHSKTEAVRLAKASNNKKITVRDVTAGVYYFWVPDINCNDNSNDSVSFKVIKIG